MSLKTCCGYAAFYGIVSCLLPRRWRQYRLRNATTLTFLLFVICFCYYHLSWSSKIRLACSSQINHGIAASAPRKLNILSYDDIAARDYVEDRRRDSMHGGLLFRSKCLNLTSYGESRELTICIYDPHKDLQLSRYIKKDGLWEKENVAEMLKALKMFPDITLVDLGSSLGIFTLQAAAMGKEVIAVDALFPNHILLGESVIKNNLSCHVTLLHNAVHDRRGRMRVVVNPSNIGGSVVEDNTEVGEENVPYSELVDSICLNDLVPLVRGKDVFLKMDIEGSEDAVLRCADEFFTQVNVKVLLIEWMKYQHNEKASAALKDFLTSHNMAPTWGVDRDRVIDLKASHKWPDNVFWMKL